MSDNCNYSWQDIISDVFSALFLTTLGFVLIELVRPGSISSAINVFFLFAISAVLSLILMSVNEEFSYRLPRSWLILAALFVGLAIMIISSATPFERFILGVISFITTLFFVFIL